MRSNVWFTPSRDVSLEEFDGLSWMSLDGISFQVEAVRPVIDCDSVAYDLLVWTSRDVSEDGILEGLRSVLK